MTVVDPHAGYPDRGVIAAFLVHVHGEPLPKHSASGAAELRRIVDM
jgi:hypothetical protein